VLKRLRRNYRSQQWNPWFYDQGIHDRGAMQTHSAACTDLEATGRVLLHAPHDQTECILGQTVLVRMDGWLHRSCVASCKRMGQYEHAQARSSR
jgi:hypothetical protein